MITVITSAKALTAGVVKDTIVNFNFTPSRAIKINKIYGAMALLDSVNDLLIRNYELNIGISMTNNTNQGLENFNVTVGVAVINASNIALVLSEYKQEFKPNIIINGGVQVSFNADIYLAVALANNSDFDFSLIIEYETI